MSVRGKPKVHNELGFALMAVNLRKYSAINNENGTFSSDELRKRLCLSFLIITTFFYSFETSYVPASFSPFSYFCAANCSLRASFAACTITFSAAIVSSSFLVFNPQSGFTQNCLGEIVCNARSIFCFTSSTDGILGL